MTHLSDYSFLQRACELVYLFMFAIYRVWQVNRFKCLHPSRFRNGELKSIVTLMVLICIPCQLYYDITSTIIKYQEGFLAIPDPAQLTNPLADTIITKPEMLWTPEHQSLVVPTDYTLCVGFSLQTGTLFLLQSFWNYLANSVAKANFMGSWEFRLYIVWSVVSMAMFPILQWVFSRPEAQLQNPNWKEIVPELAYGIELFIIACLGIHSHFRFRRLIHQSKSHANAKQVTRRLNYFMEMNKILTFCLTLCAASFIILSGDGLTKEMYLNTHKFTADLLICNANLLAIVVWFMLIMIFHPREGYGGPGTDTLLHTMQKEDKGFSTNGYPAHNEQSIGVAVSNGPATDYIPYQSQQDTSSLSNTVYSPTTASFNNQVKTYNRPMSPAPRRKMTHNESVTSNDIPPTSPVYSSREEYGDTRPLATEMGVDFFPVTNNSPAAARPSLRGPRNASGDIPMRNMSYDGEAQEWEDVKGYRQPPMEESYRGGGRPSTPRRKGGPAPGYGYGQAF